jgi:hypothetical protein
MLVVLLILPSVLYVFDRIIIATTLGAKKAIAAHATAENEQEVTL